MVDQIEETKEKNAITKEHKFKINSVEYAEHYTDLMKWPILNILEPNFVGTIHMLLVFGLNGKNALFVTKDDMVYGLGSNTDACLGLGHSNPVFVPEEIKGLCQKKIKTFVKAHNCGMIALSQTGIVYCWGMPVPNFLSGNYVEPTIDSFPEPVHITSIACGAHHCLALTTEGKLYCCGVPEINTHKMMCTGNEHNFKKMNFCHNVVYICCGYSWNMVIVQDGALYAWGYNSFGQLGFHHNQYTKEPIHVAALKRTKIIKVACGYAHTLALSDTGTVYAWGSDTLGQLGVGKQDMTSSIIKTVKLPFVNDIEAMYCSHISVARAGTTLYMWGECMGQHVAIPTPISLNSIHDVFACATPALMPRPLMYCGEGQINAINIIEQAFNDATTSDLTIMVEEKPIFVHKVILKIRSEYFRMMFREHWAENDKSVIEHEIFPYNVYEAFLKYLYSGKLNISAEEAIEMLKLAKMYGDGELEIHSERCVRFGITADNVACVYAKTIEIESTSLEDYCFHYALNCMTYVVQSPGFSNLSHDVMKRFIHRASIAHAFKK